MNESGSVTKSQSFGIELVAEGCSDFHSAKSKRFLIEELGDVGMVEARLPHGNELMLNAEMQKL